MITDETVNLDPFEHFDAILTAFEEACDEGERTLYLRGAVRILEVQAGKVHGRISMLVDALTNVGCK